MDSDSDTACAVGCPIRRSRDQRLLASPPGLSQRATSFIASQCQGIHQMPLSSRLSTTPNGKHQNRIATAPRRPGCGNFSLCEDTSRTAQSMLTPARPVRLGHITTLSAPFNQPRCGCPQHCRSIFSERRAAPLASWPLIAAVVEVNGFEPMTSCLQSRRSPS